MEIFQAFTDYLSLERKYAKHTVQAYLADISSFAVFFEEHFGVVAIATADYVQIRRWIIDLSDSGLSNRSINRKIASLKAYYKFLLKTEQLSVNPLAKHRALKTAKKIQIPFSEQEVLDVVHGLEDGEGFRDLRDKLIVELFYATGMRRAELVSLEVADIDFSNKQLKVLGKRNKERYVPLLPSVLETLRQYLVVREGLVSQGLGLPLLLTEKGCKIYETLVYRVINGYFSRVSSKEKKSPHILRHSFATHLLNEGANLNAVKELLGHSSLASTEVYTHHNIKQLHKVYDNAHPRNKK